MLWMFLAQHNHVSFGSVPQIKPEKNPWMSLQASQFLNFALIMRIKQSKYNKFI